MIATTKRIAMVFAMATLAWSSWAVPVDVNYQGRLLDTVGNPINGTVPVAVTVWTDLSAGDLVFTQEIGSVMVENGLYDFVWGGAGLGDVLTNDFCWFQVHVNGEILSPRHRLVAVPYAVRAGVADQLSAEGIAQLATNEAFSSGGGVTLGGDGSDGVLDVSSGTVSFDALGEQVLEKNFESIAITGTGSITITNVHSNGTVFILKSQGDVTLTSSAVAIDLRGRGGLGGLGGAGGVSGTPGSTGTSFGNDEWQSSGAGGDTAGAGGLPGGSYLGTYAVGGLLKVLYGGLRTVSCGSGGGGGASGSGGNTMLAGANGGNGGGALMLESGGVLTFSSTIDVAGENGLDAPDSIGVTWPIGGGGGGGGGSPGMALLIASSVAVNTGTFVTSGGNGGEGSTTRSGGGTSGTPSRQAGGGGSGAGATGGAGGTGGAGAFSLGAGGAGIASASGGGGGGGGSATRLSGSGTIAGGVGGTGAALNAQHALVVALDNP